MRLVTFDPGESTGIADGGLAPGDAIHLQVADWNTLVRWVDIHGAQQDSIFDVDQWWMVEAFNLFPHKTVHKTWSSFPEVEVIGLLRGVALMRDIKFTTITPGTYKPVASKIPIPESIGRLSKHEQDAYRLFMYTRRFRDKL